MNSTICIPDIASCVLSVVDFNVVVQKDLTIVCKLWKCVLEQRTDFDFNRRLSRLSINTIYFNRDKVNWYNASVYQTLPEYIIEEFQDKINWRIISHCQKLSEEFIGKHQDRIHWWLISRHQKLSEEFIEKHQERVDWICIQNYQELSEEFRSRFAAKLN